jgi:hypothetical protein
MRATGIPQLHGRDHGGDGGVPARETADAGEHGLRQTVGAVDNGGTAQTWSGGSWSGAVPITGAGELDSVLCSSASFCVAVCSTWTATTNIGPAGVLSTVLCTSSSFCVAGDSSKDGGHGNALMWKGSAWSAPVNIDPGGGGLPSVSCSSASFCVAVDGNGALNLERQLMFGPGRPRRNQRRGSLLQFRNFLHGGGPQ